MIAKKVLLVGNFGVGKTSLIRRFVLNKFSEDYISTIGVRVSSKIVQYKCKDIKLLIWDVAGTNGEDKIPKAYFLGASAAMFVFDLSREETYINLEAQIEVIRDLSNLKEITIVGNKKAKIEDVFIQITISLTAEILSISAGNFLKTSFKSHNLIYTNCPFLEGTLDALKFSEPFLLEGMLIIVNEEEFNVDVELFKTNKFIEILIHNRTSVYKIVDELNQNKCCFRLF